MANTRSKNWCRAQGRGSKALPLAVTEILCCGGDLQVWNAVDNQARKQHTSIIHGKYSHEETVATASFATTYLIVRDLEEAQYLADYITHGGDRNEFLQKYPPPPSARRCCTGLTGRLFPKLHMRVTHLESNPLSCPWPAASATRGPTWFFSSLVASSALFPS